MEAHLVTYLTDHAAACVATVELAKRSHSSNKGTALGNFLEGMIPELEREHETLKEVITRLDSSESVLKNMAAWGAEKAGRLKLNNSLLRYSELSRVVELESLIAAYEIKMIMWNVLNTTCTGNPVFSGIDCAGFAAENKARLEMLKGYHNDAAQAAFTA